MNFNTTNVILTLLGITLVLCFVLTLMDNTNTNNNNNSVETFDPVIDAIQTQLQKESPEQLKDTIKNLQQRLIDYGYAPDLDNYVKKTELSPSSGKCIVATAEDRDKYISKTDIPAPGPRIDLSQYVKKSSIPPEKVCPSIPEIDYSAYVKKSTLPPSEKCPPCIAPKVKVSAGLCRECPPPPPCPAPQPCPQLRCPEPAPCPTLKECKKCDEIRYIKVPTVITKTITVDTYGNIVSQNVDSGNVVPTQMSQAQPKLTESQVMKTSQNQVPQVTKSASLLNSIFGSNNVSETALMPSTTFPEMSSTPNTTLAQTLAKPSNNLPSFCPAPELNSEFKSYGIYGR